MKTHNFYCRKCKLAFNIEHEFSDTLRLHRKLKRGVRCPQCDDMWGSKGANIVQEIPQASKDKARDLQKLRKKNIEASAEANIMAARMRQEMGEPEMVEVKRPKDGKVEGNIMPGKATERVPKSVIDSLKSRANPDG